MAYVAELGGDVPVRDDCLQTSNPRVYIAGDSAGIEEATAAILEGELAAINVAQDILSDRKELIAEDKTTREKLKALRKGPVGEHVRKGLNKVRRNEDAGKDRYSRSWKG